MLLDKRDKFLLKQAKDEGAKALYEGYLSSVEGTNDLVNEKAIEYLKCFVNYPGNLCEGIVRSVKNESLSQINWGDEYLFLLTIIAAYHLDRNEILTGLLWAKKAVDLFGYFAPTLKKEFKDEFIYDMAATSMICAFQNQFNEGAYDQFFLDWEVQGFYYNENVSYLNDNHQESIPT